MTRIAAALHMETGRPAGIQFVLQLARFFLEWEMFQTVVTEKIKTHILFLIIFFRKSYRFWGNVEKIWQCDMALRRCDLHAAIRHTHTNTQTHSHYVTLVALSQQEWWRKRVPVLRYTYCAILINTATGVSKTNYTQYGADSWQCSVIQRRVSSDFGPKLYSYEAGVCHLWRRSLKQPIVLWNGFSTVLFYKEENPDTLYLNMWNSLSASYSQSDILHTS
jgi:hypothetical protein